MLPRGLASAVLAAALCALAGCASLAPAPPRPARRPPLSQAERDQIDRDFYLAVDAYAKGDYATADGYITTILRLSPRDKDALAMRRRVRAAEKLVQR